MTLCPGDGCVSLTPVLVDNSPSPGALVVFMPQQSDGNPDIYIVPSTGSSDINMASGYHIWFAVSLGVRDVLPSPIARILHPGFPHSGNISVPEGE